MVPVMAAGLSHHLAKASLVDVRVATLDTASRVSALGHRLGICSLSLADQYIGYGILRNWQIQDCSIF